MSILNIFLNRKGIGLIKGIRDTRDYEYKPTGISLSSIDLRDKFPVVTNQGAYNSCTANAVCALMDYYLVHKKKFPWDIYNCSEAFLWYYSRKSEGVNDINSGVVLRNVFKTILDKGFVPQDLWDFDKGYKTEPYDRVQIAGLMYKLYLKQLPSYQRLYTINDIKNALSNEYPVVFGYPVTKEFMNLKTENVDSINGTIIGNHAMIIVGYNSDGFIVRNSWGNNWGNNGHCILHYSLFENKAFDIWTLK